MEKERKKYLEKNPFHQIFFSTSYSTNFGSDGADGFFFKRQKQLRDDFSSRSFLKEEKK
jgi:hypothetical protein